jgi:hypothetical protein
MDTAASEGAGGANGLKPGDLCHHGANVLPLYRVIWIEGGRAWVRDVNTGADAVVDIDRCRLCGPDGGFVEAEEVGPTPVTWPDGSPRP